MAICLHTADWFLFVSAAVMLLQRWGEYGIAGHGPSVCPACKQYTAHIIRDIKNICDCDGRGGSRMTGRPCMAQTSMCRRDRALFLFTATQVHRFHISAEDEFLHDRDMLYCQVVPWPPVSQMSSKFAPFQHVEHLAFLNPGYILYFVDGISVIAIVP